MSPEPQTARLPRWQARPETTPRAALIGMFAANEGDEALLNEIVDFIEAQAARVLAASGDIGTETRCRLDGVHEHAFRGPHRFIEFEPEPSR